MHTELISESHDPLIVARESTIGQAWPEICESIFLEVIRDDDGYDEDNDIRTSIELIAKVFDTLSGVAGAKDTVWGEGEITWDTVQGIFAQDYGSSTNDNGDQYGPGDDWVNSTGKRVRLIAHGDTKTIVKTLYEVYKVALRPKITKDLGDIVCAIEPTLALAAERQHEPVEEVDHMMLQAAKNARRSDVITRFGFDPEKNEGRLISRNGSVAEYRRTIQRLEDEPPQKSSKMPEAQRTLSDEQKAHYEQLAQKYQTINDDRVATEKSVSTLAALMSYVCTNLSNGHSLQFAIMDYLEDRLASDPSTGSAVLMDFLLLTRTPPEQLQIIDSLSFNQLTIFPGMGGESQTTEHHPHNSTSLAFLAKEYRSRAKKLPAGLGFVALNGYDASSVITHDGGDIFPGRMLILGDAHKYGGTPDPGTESVGVTAPGINKEMIIPGFTSDVCLQDRLFVSAGERDLYDISNIQVSAERFIELKKAAQAGGLTVFADILTEMELAKQVRLDRIVEALQCSTQYVMGLGWNTAAEFKITELPNSRFTKNGWLIGNCTVSAAVLGDVLRLCGMKKVEPLTGILLNSEDGKLPLHVQVGFTNSRTGLVYVADSTGSSEEDGLMRDRLISTFTVLQKKETSNKTNNTSEAQAYTVPEEIDGDEYTEAMMDARTGLFRLADAYLANSYSTPESLHHARIDALVSLGQEHVVRDFFSIIHRADTKEILPLEAKNELATYLERLRNLKALCVSHLEMDAASLDEAQRRSAEIAQKVLFGQYDDLLYIISTANTLYERLIRI